MSKTRLVVSVAAVVLLVAVVFLVYGGRSPAALAQELAAKPDANFACNCSGGGISAGMAVLHCTCGVATCMAVRSTAAPGTAAVSCVK